MPATSSSLAEPEGQMKERREAQSMFEGQDVVVEMTRQEPPTQQWKDFGERTQNYLLVTWWPRTARAPGVSLGGQAHELRHLLHGAFVVHCWRTSGGQGLG